MTSAIVVSSATLDAAVSELREKFPAWSETHRKRIDRAVGIVACEYISRGSKPHQFYVNSSSSVSDLHFVDREVGSCSCPDHTRRGTRYCKHRIACYLAVRALELERADFPAHSCDGSPHAVAVAVDAERGTWHWNDADWEHVCADGATYGVVLGWGGQVWCGRCDACPPQDYCGD